MSPSLIQLRVPSVRDTDLPGAEISGAAVVALGQPFFLSSATIPSCSLLHMRAQLLEGYGGACATRGGFPGSP